MAQVVLRRHLGGLVGLDQAVQADGLLPVLAVLIAGPGLGVQLPGLLILLAGAEHLRAQAAGVVAVGKALAGEGLL